MNNESSSDRFIELHSELVEMPEYQLFLQLRTLNTPIYIFEQNYVELKLLIEYVTDDPEGITLGVVYITLFHQFFL